MWVLLFLYSALVTSGLEGAAAEYYTTPGTTPGKTDDYFQESTWIEGPRPTPTALDYSTSTETSPTAQPSCQYNCGNYMGSCSCSSSCQYYGNCCPDYNDHCLSTTNPSGYESTEPGTQDSNLTDCGGYLTSSSGTFYSPNYPNPYPNNAVCVWYIRLSGQRVELELSDVNIELESSCFYDAIYIYDGPSTSSSLLGMLCGRKNSTFYSTGPSLTVSFKSDSIVSYSGFRAYYRAVGPMEPTPTAQPSCQYNCGNYMGSCSCSSSCQYYGNCCPDYNNHCLSTTTPSGYESTAQPSCQYNCGNYMGSCSCSSSCQYYGNCCPDYNSYCYQPTVSTNRTTTARPSCRYNCGYNMGSCSCSSSCQYNGNCCHDYNSYCYSTTVRPTSAQPSCRYNCGNYMGSCSCSSSCQYYGNCCPDYNSYCYRSTVSTVRPTTARPSCRYNCGYHMGSCSCSSSCQYYGNCCPDYNSYCYQSTVRPTRPSTALPSCRYNCGYNMGSCSCYSSCQYYGNCCPDYNSYCYQSTVRPTRSTTARPSCRYNCGYHMGSCSCSSSCQYYGNCCPDYNSYCYQSTVRPTRPSTALPSCRYNCGYNMGSCSCYSSCQYYGNCCPDYNSYCYQSTVRPTRSTTARPSCRYNCGYHMGSCSCSSSCQYYGNCCPDYNSYCSVTSPPRPIPTTAGSCGGFLFGSGTFSSPNHPYYYQDNAYCVWQIKAEHDQRIVLSFTYLQLENCCSCDYISIYDGPSVGSRYLGKLCNNTVSTFYSSSNYMTVLFRTDGSVVAQGFRAEFFSSLLPSSGRVDCSSDKMTIVISRSYLNSVGYDGYNLYLNDPYCRPQVSSNQVVFSFHSNTCGNIREFNNGRVVYSNTVRSEASSSGVITRHSHFRLNVTCQMDQDSVSHTMFIVRNSGNSTITGTGRFNTTMSFYTSSNFYYKVTEVPYEVSLNEKVFVQVDLPRRDSSLVLFIDTCVASPSQYDFQTRSYYLIRTGCPVDSTYQSYVSGTADYARFAFRTFKFLQAKESVYIQCRVLICQASDYSSRCRRGCMRRVARDLESQHESQTLLVGPIKLKDPEKKEEEPEKQNKV
ncbi:deleted in malignant brain tumors 1 protein-like isoform X4 [Parambassis ranga]|uniref:Deleted in malignant brain tumors 1 protein-like isoform X4 n=1 Tax=Parambassis ranga TaxID=210632 RepID=A0A6P7JQ56_9TELE|nr:deleted in malignant brain tumors 1 protein-like isoform X4 [Parambassis ranga]